MKKKIILTIGILFLLNGCVRTTTTQTINKDKSMNFETIVLVKDKFKDKLTEIKQQELINNKYNISEFEEDGYTGLKITKIYKDIDKVSDSEGQTVILSDFLKGTMDDTILFKVKESFFKNTYTAKMKYKLRSEIYSYEQNHTIASSDENITLESEMKFKYIVKLPYEVISSNANVVSKDGKTLTWNLNKSLDTDITYTFTLLNMKHYYIVYAIAGGVGLIVLILIIIIIVKVRKKHKSDEPIHVDYDPSIEEDLKDENAPLVAEESANNTIAGAYEYTLPEEEKAKEEIKVAAVAKPVEEQKKNKFLTEEEELEELDFGNAENKEKLDMPDIEKL